jgi:peptide/nickel transport system permease protein
VSARVARIVAREAALGLALLAAVTLAMYALLDCAPGDPVSLYVNVQSLSPSELAQVRHELGLDRSFPGRYAAWAARLLQGDLGHSLRSGRPVADELGESAGRTLVLTASALALTLLFAAGSATLAALRRHPGWAALATGTGYLLSGLPIFWLGYLAIFLATRGFDFFPVFSEGAEGGAAWAQFCIPVVVLGLGNGTVSEVTRHLRIHLETVLREDYVRTARAKGASLARHLYKEGFVLPLSSLIATRAPYLLGGAIVVEQIFNWPGLGRLTWQATLDRDYPLLLGAALFAALFVRLAHLAKETVQAAVDPQLRD